ncbi:MAG: hypothetical protein ACREEM_34695 [Blastocatellia bacterium]
MNASVSDFPIPEIGATADRAGADSFAEPAAASEREVVNLHRDDRDVQLLLRMSASEILIVLALLVSLACNIWQYWRRPDRIVVDRRADGDYVVMVNDRTVNAGIAVKGDQHPVIRIGMAPSGITVIEFPASDRFFAAHPPENGDWVEVEKSPSLKTDHHLVLRAGKDLMTATGPAASVSVQMRSGLIVTIWVYPVKLITQQTHRCVVSYDRAEVIAARRKAGLAVNLGEAETGETLAEAKAASETAAANSKPSLEPQAPLPAAPSDPDPVVADLEVPAAGKSSELPAKGVPAAAVKKALAQAMAEPKQFKTWTPALHGLSLSVSTITREMNNGTTQLALVAVRNSQSEAVRIVPGHPELFVETLDEKGKTLQVAPVRKLSSDSTTTNSVVPAGATVYFALAYPTPVLGVKQRLRVAVGQTNAADDPAAADLTAYRNLQSDRWLCRVSVQCCRCGRWEPSSRCAHRSCGSKQRAMSKATDGRSSAGPCSWRSSRGTITTEPS